MRLTIADDRSRWLILLAGFGALAMTVSAEDRVDVNNSGNASPANRVDRSFYEASQFDSSHVVTAQSANQQPNSLPRDNQPTARGQSPERAAPLPLSPPTKRTSSGSDEPKSRTPTGALTTVMGSLAVVLGLFMIVVWFTRRALPQAATSLPKEVIEVLGRSVLAQRQQMQLVRVGNKLLLLCISATGVDTLTEITDREEVDRIAGLCHQNQPDSITSTFRQVLAQFGGGPADADVSSIPAATTTRASRRSLTHEGVND